MIANVLGGIRNPKIRRASMAVVLVLFLLPISAFSADSDSIATLRQMGKAFASIAGKASPAVVGIQATKVVKSPYGRGGLQFDDPSQEDLFRYFFGPRRSPRQQQEREQRQVAQGSGFLISSDGYILTNNHMVGGAETVTVQLADGTKVSAEVVGADPQTDVALVKIDKTGLPYVEMADSDKLEVGEWVIAIGNPFGLSHTVTAGIVSAKGRSRIGVADYEDFIQTDAAINLGNSGGPLLNLDGKAVGINTAIIGPGANNVGIGLAIPSNMAQDIYTQLKATGEVVRGYLGIAMNDIEAGMGEYFKLDNDDGVIVMEVKPDSPADKAGLQKDDVIVEFEGKPVKESNEFRNHVAMYKPGSKIRLVVIRDGKRKKLTAVLDKWPDSETLAAGGSTSLQDSLGMSLETLTKDLASRLGYDDLSGVVVTDVRAGSLAYEAGIREGTLITEVNREAIANVRDFRKAVGKAKDDGKTSVLLRIRYEEVSQLVLLRLSDK